jgi:hypothetical protein
MRIASKFFGPVLFGILSGGMSGAGYATHPAGGDCAHTHSGRVHNLCDDGADGKSCTVNGTAGTCRQTASSCLCRVPKAKAQDQLIAGIDEILATAIAAPKSKAALGAGVLKSEIDVLFDRLFEASLALLETGSLDIGSDPALGAVLDRIARNTEPAKKAFLANSSRQTEAITAEMTNLLRLVRNLKKQWATNNAVK